MLLRYNIQKLNLLLESFYTLTKIKIVVFDDTFHKIAEYPNRDCAFCSMIRTNAEADQKCHESDRIACETCSTQGKAYSYTCHAGLTETVTPIRFGTFTIGYLMFGQVLQHKKQKEYWETVRGLCRPYQFADEQLIEAYNKKRPVELKQLYAAAQLMEACASYLWLERTISLQEDSLPQQIDDYITNNLDANLSTAALCEHFGISRSRLYKIASEYYGKGIEQTTRALRIDKAKKMLTETSEHLNDIAEAIGCNDYNYFIKLFKKETGQTPARYRKQFLNGNLKYN